MTYERITAADVQIGDRIARTRNDHFTEVVAINEGPVSRRFALVYVGDDMPEWLKNRSLEDRRRWGDPYDAGNIRPKRTAKLWRLVA